MLVDTAIVKPPQKTNVATKTRYDLALFHRLDGTHLLEYAEAVERVLRDDLGIELTVQARCLSYRGLQI